MVSGRAGFELVQKAATVGRAPWSPSGRRPAWPLALARESGLALFGFTSAERVVRYG